MAALVIPAEWGEVAAPYPSFFEYVDGITPPTQMNVVKLRTMLSCPDIPISTFDIRHVTTCHANWFC